MPDHVDENDRIQLPPGWGPVIFLAAVVILSDIALGLRVRSMLVNRTVATDSMGAGHGPSPGNLPNVPLSGQAAPGASGGPGVDVGAGAAGGSTSYTIDESEFTQELDDYVRTVAEASGMAPDAVPTAREVYQQMQRSGLLPVNGDLDAQTVLGGHVREMAQHGGGTPSGGGGPGGPKAPGGGPGMGADKAP